MQPTTTTRMNAGARQRWSDESGSLLLAAFMSLVVGGLVLALFSVVRNSQITTRRDRDFAEAINGADAGVYDVLSQLNEPSFDPNTPELTGTRTLQDVEYTFTGRRITAVSWHVTSVGTRGGVTRTVEAVLARPARFHLAAFADIGMSLNGGNIADSYPNGGNGSVGSNGEIVLNGNAYADQIQMYGPGSSCTANQDLCITNGEGNDEPLVLPTDFIEAQLQACAALGPITSYVASTSPPLVPGGGQGTDGAYCFSQVTFDVDTEFFGATGDTPVVIFTGGPIDTSNDTDVNCPFCPSQLPSARAFQMYSTGPAVTLGNRTNIGTATYAPLANCAGSPSNAAAEIYGSIVCNDLRNQGGWNFHFDEDLLQLNAGLWDVRDWREEVGGSTSFN